MSKTGQAAAAVQRNRPGRRRIIAAAVAAAFPMTAWSQAQPQQLERAFLLKKRTAVARRHLAVGSACSEAATRAGFGSRSALFRNLRKTAMPTTGHEPCCLSA